METTEETVRVETTLMEWKKVLAKDVSVRDSANLKVEPDLESLEVVLSYFDIEIKQMSKWFLQDVYEAWIKECT